MAHGTRDDGDGAELARGEGVYVARALRPLRRAAADALDLPPGGQLPAALGSVDLAPLWRRPQLFARITQAVREHALSRGPELIDAEDRAALPLASAVAHQLGLPLDPPRGAGVPPSDVGASGEDEAPGRGGEARRRYLVAGTLRAGAPGAAPRGGDPARADRTVGAAVVVGRTGTPESPVDDDNLLYIIEL